MLRRIVVVSILLLQPAYTRAQDHYTVTLNGLIQAGRGPAPIGPVRVRLQQFGMTVREDIAFDGHFQFEDVPTGPYMIVTDAPGYETSFRPTDVPGESFIVVALRPAKTAENTKPETADIHLMLARMYLKKNKLPEVYHELELYVKEAPPGPTRDQAVQALALRKK